MRGLFVYVVIQISRCHAHLRRDIHAMDDVRIESNEESVKTNVVNVKSVIDATNGTNGTNTTFVDYVDNDIRTHLNPEPVTTSLVNATIGAKETDATDVTNWTLVDLWSYSHGHPTEDTYGTRAEYYGNVVTCAGKTFLLTRFEHTKDWLGGGWQTRVRDLEDFSKNVVDLPSMVLSYNFLSHNVAALCWKDEVIMIGGQYRRHQKEPHWHGVWMSRTSPSNLAKFAEISKPKLMFRGNHTGCVERRPGFTPGHCEFDGRFSLIHYRGKFIIYARANTPSRHVQMTSSEDLVHWSPFQLIEVSGVNHARSQIYFLTATVVYVNEWIVGYFPGILELTSQDLMTDDTMVGHRHGRHDSTGVHITWSKDGRQWGPPTNVHRTSGIYSIHPVGIFNRRLLTQRPTKVKNAFQSSQVFSFLHPKQDMNQNLSLAMFGDKERDFDLMGESMDDDVVYTEELWNE